MIRYFAAFAALIALCAIPVFAGAVQRCTVTLKADGNTAAVQRAMERPGKATPVVCLRAGIYKGARLLATRSVVLQRTGKGKVVLDAGERGRMVTLLDKDIEVTLRGLTLTGGVAEEGAAVAVLRDSRLRMEDCWLTDNRATSKGAAVHVGGGLAVLVRTRITRNDAPRAGAIYVAPGARIVLAHTLIAGNRNQGGANAPVYFAPGSGGEILYSTIAYNHAHGIYIQPSEKRTLTPLRVDSSIVMGGSHAIWVSRSTASMVEVYRSVVHGEVGFIPLDLKTSRQLPVFTLNEPEPQRYRPTLGSPAIKRGACTSRFGKTDISGKRRPSLCTAGAVESNDKEIAKTMAERDRIAKIKKRERKADEAFNW